MIGQLELAPGMLALPSGALWLVEGGALLLAEAHLGYGWAERHRGEPGPDFDGGAHRRLKALVDELKPKVLVFLGDVMHRPLPSAEERAAVVDILNTLAKRTEVVIVRGAPDRAHSRDLRGLPARLAEEWRQNGAVAVHRDQPETPVPRGHTLVFGHLRPAATIYDAAGAGRRLPAFLRSRRAIMLPAFSPFAGGVDVGRGVPAELRDLLGRGPVQVAVTTGRRVVTLKLLGGG